jgi:hypothetical protein
MYLTAITQRQRLFDLSTRWLRGQLEPEDGRFLTLTFLLDPQVTAPVVTSFLRDIVAPLGEPTRVEHLSLKAEVRDRIAHACKHPGPRVRELLDHYRECPERFYPTTPVDMFAISGGERDLLAMVRFKSIPRIADKVSRRATDCFEQEILRRAQALADKDSRASTGGGDGPRSEAETQVCSELACGHLSFSPQDLLVGDLIGAKLIGRHSELEQLEAKIVSHPRVVSVRKTEHRGNYIDTRLEVELTCPAPDATIGRLLSHAWRPEGRGFSVDDLRRAIPAYIESSEKTFFIDIILTTCEDLVESEFGLGLHEVRTERQRENLWRSHQLSNNVAMITMFMLLVAVSPTTEVGWLPIKLTGRYLPDGMAVILGRLFNLDLDRSPLWLPPLRERRSLATGAIGDGSPFEEGEPGSSTEKGGT